MFRNCVYQHRAGSEFVITGYEGQLFAPVHINFICETNPPWLNLFNQGKPALWSTTKAYPGVERFSLFSITARNLGRFSSIPRGGNFPHLEQYQMFPSG